MKSAASEGGEEAAGLATQVEQLGALWDRVNQLSELRENRLHGATKLVS